jgi:hypothetical protein
VFLESLTRHGWPLIGHRSVTSMHIMTRQGQSQQVPLAARHCEAHLSTQASHKDACLQTQTMLAGLVQASCIDHCCSRAHVVAMHGQKGHTQHGHTETHPPSRDVQSKSASVAHALAACTLVNTTTCQMAKPRADACTLPAVTLHGHTASLLLHWPQPVAQQLHVTVN